MEIKTRIINKDLPTPPLQYAKNGDGIEVWRPVKGYEGIYRVSNKGRIINDITGNILKGYKNKKGYISVKLYNKGNSKCFFMHRIVAIAFINNKENKNQINHINGINTDNNVGNLEWCTNLENMNHRYTSLGKDKYSLHFNKERCKWESYINHNGNKINLGRY